MSAKTVPLFLTPETRTVASFMLERERRLYWHYRAAAWIAQAAAPLDVQSLADEMRDNFTSRVDWVAICSSFIAAHRGEE